MNTDNRTDAEKAANTINRQTLSNDNVADKQARIDQMKAQGKDTTAEEAELAKLKQTR